MATSIFYFPHFTVSRMHACCFFNLSPVSASLVGKQTFFDVAESDLFTEKFLPRSKQNIQIQTWICCQTLLEVGQSESLRNMWVSSPTYLSLFFSSCHPLVC